MGVGVDAGVGGHSCVFARSLHPRLQRSLSQSPRLCVKEEEEEVVVVVVCG